MARTKQTARKSTGGKAGRKQSAFRTVPLWQLVNLDAGDKICLLDHLRSHFRGIGDNWDSVLDIICHIYPPNFEDIALPSENLILTAFRDRDCPLTDLPTEVLQSILSSLEDINDAVSLTIACKQLLAIGRLHYTERLSKIINPWAGARIVCIRDHPHYTLSRLCDEAPSDDTKSKETVVPFPDDIDLDILHERFESQPTFALTIHDRSKLFNGTSHLPSRDANLFDRFKERNDEPNSHWVLCNLTKHQYILKDTKTYGEDISLRALLMSQICWSTDPTEDFWEGAPARGKWVGDIFEITTLDRLRAGGEDWMDVGEEVVKEMKCIRESAWFQKLS